MMQNRILQFIANGESLDRTAEELCVQLERILPNIVCSILTVDGAGLLHPLAAPNLPADYSAALDGTLIGPDVGSCGSAAYLRGCVFIEDVHRDHRFARFHHLMEGLDLKACWSFPVTDAQGSVVAVFAMYSREARAPLHAERSAGALCVDLLATALRRHQRVLIRERRSANDALTGLPNRGAFDAALMNIGCEEPGSWALFVIDLDNLKVVNDTFGHMAGDSLLRTAAQRISQAMAPDVTFRMGGDEFAVIIQSPNMLADLELAAGHIFEELRLPALCHGHSVIPRATIGGAVLGHREPTAAAVQREADIALYHAKETGKGGFLRYQPGIGTRITHRHDAIRDVADALAEGRIEAHYQPIVRLETGHVIGLEALCRLRTPEGELIEAGAFYEATSDAHVAAELTQQMAEAIARDLAWWRTLGLPLRHVGLNVSTADFYLGSLTEKLQAIFRKVDIPLDTLVVEVTEDVYIGRKDRIVAREIAALRSAGVRVALDDFGTGFASLTHLLLVPLDVIKIDRTFVERLQPGDPSLIIVQGLIEIARKLGMYVIAEGIETEDQAKRLFSMGCLLGQGFAFSRALDREATANLLRLYVQGAKGLEPKFSDNRYADPFILSPGDPSSQQISKRAFVSLQPGP